MAKRFTRNIQSIKDIEKQPKYTNQQNDLLSDDKEVYIRNQGKYEKITGNVEKVNNKEPDDSGNVEIDTGAMTVNNEKPDKKGNVTIDTGAMTVNNEKPDKKGNVTIDTGTMTVNDKKPDDSGNVELNTGVMQVNGKDPDESGNIDVDSGVKTVTNVEPDENGNVNLQLKDFTGEEKIVRKNQLNEALEGIELDYKNYTDNAVEGYATKQYVDNIDIPEQPDLSQYRTKQEIEELIKTNLPKFENEELVMTDTFENAFPDRKATKLQYVLQGNIMQIFGLIRTKKELKGKDTHVVAKIPDKFSPIIEGYNYGTMGARFHFKTYVNEKNDSAYPNEITIRRITDVDNHYIDLPADEKGVFHISLTIGVEVNG